MLFRFLLLLLTAFNAYAEEGGFYKDHLTLGGMGFGNYVAKQDEKSKSLGIGTGLSGEGLVLSKFRTGSQTHYLVIDAKLMSFIGGGAGKTGNESVEALFRLKFIGSLSGGVQVFRLVPITPGIEDFVWDINGGKKTKKSLVGATIYMPIPLDEKRAFYLGTTIGNRSNNLTTDASAIQPKLRYVGDRFTGELRYLRTFGGADSTENRVVGQFDLYKALNELDQLSVLVEFDSLDYKDPARGDVKSVNGLLFYGRSLDF